MNRVETYVVKATRLLDGQVIPCDPLLVDAANVAGHVRAILDECGRDLLRLDVSRWVP